MRKSIARFLTSYASVPLLLFLAAAASFGPLLRQQGAYWDDWEIILTLKMFGLGGLWEYFQGPRPLAAWTYFVFAPLLGPGPFGWQILTLLLRWLSAVAMAWVFARVWPEKRFAVTLAAFLFLIYPVFMEQPIAISYHQHWLGYLLYFASLAAMLTALHHPRRYWLWTGLAGVAMLMHLTILEYFAGVELLRPLILFLLPEMRALPPRRRLALTVSRWAPYLFLLGLFALARVLLAVQLAEDTNRPALLFDLASAPLAALARLAPIAYHDTWFVLVTAWNKVIPIELLEPFNAFSMFQAGIGLALASGLGWYLSHLHVEPSLPENVPAQRNADKEIIALGMAAFVLGMLPAWIIYRQASGAGLFMDRYGLPAMFGASLVWAGLLEWFSPNRVKKALVVALMVGLAAGLHLRTANTYRWSWIDQMRVSWQLRWRAPSIEPSTYFLADDQLFLYVSPGFLFNTLYNQPHDPQEGMYFFEYLKTLPLLDPAGWDSAQIMEKKHRIFRGRVSATDSLILDYQPGSGTANCLWVLRPDDSDDPTLSPRLRQALALPLANLGRISDQTAPPPDPAIFGQEPAHGWCYYYETAELARQIEDWSGVVALEESARAQGFSPTRSGSDAPHEWLPFVVGNAKAGRWAQALQITLDSAQKDPRYAPVYCRIWQEVTAGAAPDVEGEAAARQARAALGCPLPPPSDK